MFIEAERELKILQADMDDDEIAAMQAYLGIN